ncbi:MAG: hypothetical protein H0W99_05925 [Acidobacteria bacterium]|nr:hypothetical protein [Acidobacteriota bacterium]
MDEQETSPDAPAHTPGTDQGEDKSTTEGKEAGRFDHDHTHADRPAGGSTARDSTSINPEKREPIDPRMPDIPQA